MLTSFNKKTLLAATCIGAAYGLMVHRYWFLTDDAFISFRYARNWVDGIGLRYNPGEHLPVEGYSNFLWVLVCGVIEWLGLSPMVYAPLLSSLLGGVLLYRVYGVAKDALSLSRLWSFWVVAFLALFPGYGIWASGGLATMPFALAVFCVFEWTVFGSKSSAFVKAGIVAIIAALLRVEGVVWVVGIVAVAVVARFRQNPLPRKGLVIFSVLFVLGFGLFLLWRYNYYGRWLPNTVDAKSGLSLPILERGFHYVVVFFLTFVSFFLLIPASIVALQKKYRPYGVPLVVCSWAAMAYSVGVGGDFMPMGRFLVSAFPFVALLCGVLGNHFGSGSKVRQRIVMGMGVVVIILNLLPGWDMHAIPFAVRANFHFRFNKMYYNSEYEQWVFMKANADKWEKLGLALKEYALPEDSLVSGGMGSLGYYSGLFIYDRYGLVDANVKERPSPEMRHSPGHDRAVPPSYFLKDKPTYIMPLWLEGDDLKPRLRMVAAHWLKLTAKIGYVPDMKVFRREGVPRILMILRRIRPKETKRRGIGKFKKAVVRFLKTG